MTREERAREVLADVTERLAPKGIYIARDMRAGILNPDSERAIAAMLAFADAELSSRKESVEYEVWQEDAFGDGTMTTLAPLVLWDCRCLTAIRACQI